MPKVTSSKLFSLLTVQNTKMSHLQSHKTEKSIQILTFKTLQPANVWHLCLKTESK